MGLFAEIPIDEVTVQDIAAAVEMTPAAVYYHFASKEQILSEGMEQFGAKLIAEVRNHTPAPGDEDGLGRLLAHVMTWTAKRKPDARVYFVNSIGLNQMVEALRRATRIELIELVTLAVTNARGKLSGAEAGAIAVALVSLLETSLAAMLNQDAAYRGIGARKFGGEVVALGERIAGIAAG